MLSSRYTFAAFGVALLSACGGSSNVQPSSSQSTGTDSAFLDSGSSLSYSSSAATSAKQDSEFQRLNGTNAASSQSPYEAINAHEAYGYGVSGNGQTINIMDSSFDTSHQEIAGKTTSYGTIGSASNSAYHGLAVASIAAGKKEANGIHGVAYNANLHLTDYTYYGGETYLPDRWAQLTNDAASNYQPIAQNNSWGINVSLTDVQNRIQANNWSNAAGVAYELDQNNYDANASSVTNYVQALDDFQTTGVIVYALSNSYSFNEADFQAALPELFPQLAEAWMTTMDIEVTGANGNLTYTRQSAKCGSTAAYCLGADGTGIVTAKHDASSSTALDDAVNGTSFTAPQVSGALALLAEAFPNHTPAQLVDRLLASANNDFFSPSAYTTFINGVQHGYNSEFGHGLLDLGAAMQPIINTGSPRMVIGSSLQKGRQYQLSNSQLQASASFGDSLARGLSNTQVFVYDALNGAFPYSLSNALTTTTFSNQQHLIQHLNESRDLMTGASIAHLASPYNNVAGVQLQQAFGAVTLQSHVSTSAAQQRPPRLSMVWQSPRHLRSQLQIETGIHHASEELLGLKGSGALNLKASMGTSQFANLAWRYQLTPTWQFDLQASAAISQLSTPQDSLIHGLHNISSNALSLNARRAKLFTQDQLTFQISQPQRLNSGNMIINVGQRADANGNIQQQHQHLSLRTSGRQIDLQLDYQWWLQDNLQMGLQHLTSLEPNHIANAHSQHRQTLSLKSNAFAAALRYDADMHQSSLLLRWQGDL